MSIKQIEDRFNTFPNHCLQVLFRASNPRISSYTRKHSPGRESLLGASKGKTEQRKNRGYSLVGASGHTYHSCIEGEEQGTSSDFISQPCGFHILGLTLPGKDKARVPLLYHRGGYSLLSLHTALILQHAGSRSFYKTAFPPLCLSLDSLSE